MARDLDDAPQCPLCFAEMLPIGGTRWIQSCRCDVRADDYGDPPKELRARLGFNVSRERRRLGLSQSQLGLRVHEPQPRIAELESGTVWPGPDRLQAIADALGVWPCDLLA